MVANVEDREYIAFDSKYLLSLFKSINEAAYSNFLRRKFLMREAHLKTKLQIPPLMI